MINKYGMMYKFFRKMEKKLYVVADAIGCMTQGNIDYIKTNNTFIEPGKLHLLPNWIKPGINNQIIDQKLLEKYGLKDKFIVIFGGNLGIAQKVENIITLSKLHADKNDLVFLVIGKGTHKRYLENLIKKGKIKNILIIDFLKRTKYESFVSLSQVGFISLNENFTIPNVPSRILSYYNFKKPVFAIVDPVTDFGKMIEEDQSGFCCVYGDYKSYVDKFNQLYYDSKLRERLGNNGYSSLYNKYTPQRAYKKIAEILSI
jgi:glycosyltransferase involved in cell wall biosynthesis